MTKLLIIQNANIVRPGRDVITGSLRINPATGKIQGIHADASLPTEPYDVIDAAGQILTPGLIDVHTHGIGTFLYERSVEDILGAPAMLSRYGVTSLLPTLYRVMNRPNLGLLEKLALCLSDVKGVRMPGFHLEGPFLFLPGAGAQTVPGDMGLLVELFAACHGRIGSMSISPDSPNILPVIEYLVAHGVVPFITHTRASPEQTEAALDAGAVHGTHFYDVFPVPVEHEPGVRPVGAVEALLADPRASVDFICDGVHVHPTAIKAAIAAKSYKGVILITDSNIGAGLPAGRHDTPWGFPVRVAPGDAARIDAPDHPGYRGLAGSALTMDQGIRNLFKWLKLPPEQIWAMGTANPARLMRWPTRGVIEPGADADLVLWNDALEPVRTWVAGKAASDR